MRNGAGKVPFAVDIPGRRVIRLQKTDTADFADEHGYSIRQSELHTRKILFSEHDFSSQRAQGSKEATEADAFLCDLDPNLCALCVTTPLL